MKYHGSKFLTCDFSFHIQAIIAASGYILHGMESLFMTIIRFSLSFWVLFLLDLM